MFFEYQDFNDAQGFFSTEGRDEWDEIQIILDELVPQLQPSDQAGKRGEPIFDPKATNALLTSSAASRGWFKVPVPPSLQAFGVDWDAGKNKTLAEWQFSNYPFLWNNVIRSEAVFKSELNVIGRVPASGLIVVTKSGCFPASNSTLYYEQASAQLTSVTTLGVFDIPIRLVGLMIEPGSATLEANWNAYSGRYSREAIGSSRTFTVTWPGRSRYGHAVAKLALA
jgi:hypothetical protein